MTRLEDRRTLADHIAQARADGARLSPACTLAGIDARTLQRWKAGVGLVAGDRRPDADRPVPSHALSEAERAKIVAVCNEPRFAETPPARIVPMLADEGLYIASEARGLSGISCVRGHDGMEGAPACLDAKSLVYRTPCWTSSWVGLTRRRRSTRMACWTR